MRTMRGKLLIAAALALGAGGVARSQGGAAPSPARLTAESYAAVRAHAAPREGDLRFQTISWHENLAAGAAEAARTDRPLILWLYFGDPRGGC